MGYQMAGNVRKKMPPSATLHIYDVTEAPCRRFIDQFSSFGPIKIAQSCKEVAERSKTVISMVPNGKIVKEVYLNQEHGVIAATDDPDRLMLECSTIEVMVTQDIGRQIMSAGKGGYADTPVSGGTAGAEAGTLSFFCGSPGDKESDPIAKRIWDTVCWMGAAERVTFCGQLGSGLVCKIANNYIGLSNQVVAAEGMAFGIRNGVDRKILYRCIRGSSGDSWAMEFAQPAPGVLAHSRSSNGFQPGFSTRLCVKDIALGIQAAQTVGINASMGEMALKAFKTAEEDPRTTVSPPSANLLCRSRKYRGLNALVEP